MLRLEAVKLIRFVTLWRSGLKPLKVVLKFTFQALWIMIVVVALRWDNVSGFRPRVGWDRFACQNVTLDEDNLQGRL